MLKNTRHQSFGHPLTLPLHARRPGTVCHVLGMAISRWPCFSFDGHVDQILSDAAIMRFVAYSILNSARGE